MQFQKKLSQNPTKNLDCRDIMKHMNLEILYLYKYVCLWISHLLLVFLVCIIIFLNVFLLFNSKYSNL